MKTTNKSLRRIRGFTLVELLVVISIIVVLSGLATPVAMRALRHGERVAGLNNARNLKGMLDLFAGDFNGEYPNDETAAELAEIRSDFAPSTSSVKLQGKWNLDSKKLKKKTAKSATSDDYFAQLIGRGLDSEKLLGSKAIRRDFVHTRSNNDGVIDSGENIWAYTKNLHQTSSGYIPIIYDTPITTGDNTRFSKKTWDGKVIVTNINNATELLPIGGTDPNSGMVTAKRNGHRVNLFSSEVLEEGVLVPANLKKISR